MEHSLCPYCGSTAPPEASSGKSACPDCGWGSGSLRRRPLVARPRIQPQEARALVAQELARRGRPWVPGPPQLVFFPFSPTGNERRPAQALAPVPAVVLAGWQPGSSDLLSWGPSSPALSEGSIRVPVALPVKARALVVHYPFFRLPLPQAGCHQDAWCDAVSGQVILPAAISPVTARNSRRRRCRTLVLWSLALVALGVPWFLPFPAAFAPPLGAGLALWWMTTR